MNESLKLHAEMIGDFFRERRIKANLAPVDVVKADCCSSVEELQDYELGQDQMPLETVFKLTNLYNIPPDEVLDVFYSIVMES